MWINKIAIQSETSGREYTISELTVRGIPTGTWGCSCPGWKKYGHCKHLEARHLISARSEEDAIYWVSDDQWDRISALVDARQLTETEIGFLDRWAAATTYERHTPAANIIAWLLTLPAR